jgi:hypothetical protein
MNKYLIPAILLTTASAAYAADPVTPDEMTEDAQAKMYSIITDYNKCMMQNRLQPNIAGENPQQTAQNIMQSCEAHLDTLKAHLTENQIGTPLAEGMVKKMRSHAARHLMTATMNNLAAQAAAVQNAEKMKQEEAAQ